MTQLKTAIWPDAPPAKSGLAELTFAAKRRAAGGIAGLEGESVAITLKDDRLRVTAKAVHAALPCLSVECSVDLIEAYLLTQTE